MASRSETATPALWLARLCGALFVALSIGWAFQVASRLGVSVYKEQFLLLCLGLAGAVVFLTTRYNRRKTDTPPLFDWALALIMLAVTFYITWYYEWFLLNAAYKPPLMLVLGTIVIRVPTILNEATRVIRTRSRNIIVFSSLSAEKRFRFSSIQSRAE